MQLVDKASLEREMNDAWYERGDISEAYRLAGLARRMSISFSASGERTARRVREAHAWLTAPQELPPRCETPAYVPEPSRIMYTLHSTPVFNSNGYSTRSRGMADGLKKAGADVVGVARLGYPWDTASDSKQPSIRRTTNEVDGVTFVHNPGGNLNIDSFEMYTEKCADMFVREARRLRPAAIVSASNFRTAYPALVAARRLGIPFFYEIRGMWEITEVSKRPGLDGSEKIRLHQSLETRIAQEAEAVFAITRQVADSFVSRGIPAEKIHIAPNAVDIDKFVQVPKDSDFARKIGLSEDLLTLGFAGSVVEYEGLNLLLEASHALESRGIAHQVAIAGTGSGLSVLKDQAEALGMKNVHFLGRLPQDDIPRLLSVFDIVVCPRLDTKITQLVSPLKPLESFSAGRATVLSDVDPHVDLAGRNAARAALFPTGNAEALANTLETLMQDADRRRGLEREARLWVKRERTWEVVGKGVYDLIRRACGRRSRALQPVRNLSDLRIGIISDEFTRQSLEGSVELVPLSRTNWKNELDESKLDAVFIESAWEGNEGEWTKGIGYYSDAEFEDILGLIGVARTKGLPTIFWNKEDPVHFHRFAPIAKMVDHVFTTDAKMIEKYRLLDGGNNKTVAAMPFFAQPKIHNPLNTQPGVRRTIAHAGTYYGDRYQKRSTDLVNMLSVAAEFGVDIYDRQAANPSSPYKYPEEFKAFVRGSLPYDEVICSYSEHIAHLNVNSVVDSPTMFSRRVVEIPACGGVVLSAGCRGIRDTIGPNIPESNDRETIGSYLYKWSVNGHARLEEIWRQLRTIYRSFTADFALLYMLRTAGIAVEYEADRVYVLKVEDLDTSIADQILEQSLYPALVLAEGTVESEARSALEAFSIDVRETADSEMDSDVFVSEFVGGLPRTFYEDITIFNGLACWDQIFVEIATSDILPIAARTRSTSEGTLFLTRAAGPSTGESLLVRIPGQHDNPSKEEDLEVVTHSRASGRRTLLIAGHDLKFAQGLIAELDAYDVEVLVDQWANHTQHDEEKSRRLLEKADIVFCEWGLGNLRWFSRHIGKNQRLVVRVHLQELYRPYLSQALHENVDKFIFVSEPVRNAAVLSHGVPPEKSIVVPNSVETAILDRPKTEDAGRTLGFVGTVPQRKRVDIALDVLEELLEIDGSFTLRIKGKSWKDYPWLENRPEELNYYQEVDQRIQTISQRWPNSIVLDPFGDDMADWYERVGFILSTSDFESFHYSIADGAASGSVPVVLAWPGAELIYPDRWLSSSVSEMVSRILNSENDGADYQSFVQENFDRSVVAPKLIEEILGK